MASPLPRPGYFRTVPVPIPPGVLVGTGEGTLELVEVQPEGKDRQPASAWANGARLEPGERLSVPVKHMTGRYFAPTETLDEIEARGQVVLRYTPGQNPNGSSRDIAGVTNEAGNVLGLMPHPEHAVDPLTGSDDGLKLFAAVARAAVAA